MSSIRFYPDDVPARYAGVTWDDVPEKIQQLVDTMPETRKGIYLHGGVGTGKTHIAYGITKRVLEHHRVTVAFFNSAELINQIREMVGRKQYVGDFLDELNRWRGLLVIDDIGAERLTDWVAEQFYLLVNKRYSHKLPTVFTSNCTIADLADTLGERVASRIVEMCDIIELGGDDRRINS